jgi:hypothetical protein
LIPSGPAPCAGSGAHIHELQFDAKIPPFEKLHDFLQIIDFFARDPHLVLHDLGLDLEFAVFDKLDDFLAFFLGNALYDRDPLPHRAAGSRLLLAEIEAFG